MRHKIWGTGKVLEVIGSGENLQLKLEFPTKGVRQVMANFAPIEKV